MNTLYIRWANLRFQTREMIRFFSVLILIFSSVPVQGATLDKSSQVIFQAMEEEMGRSLRELRIDVFDTPYFVRYQIRHHDRIEIVGSFGSLIQSTAEKKRTLFVDVRVGDPKFDSSVAGSHRNRVKQIIPLDDDLDGLKRAIWQETDLRYKQAVMNFLRKKGRLVSGVENHDLADFSMGQFPVVHFDPIVELNVDRSEWENLAREVSARFKEAPEIEKSLVTVFADRYIRYYLDSEGNKIRGVSLNYGVLLEAWTKTDSGRRIQDQDTLYFVNREHVPSKQALIARAGKLIAGITALRKAPQMDPYVGPAIFNPEATAILFHESIGHRLEGDRLRTANDGKTFVKKIGKPILPPFISLIDDPRLESFKGADLLGHYLFDDEGQRSEKVVLIDHGVLKHFLLSRNPAPGFGKTNGHGRSDGLRFPVARMGNTVVRSHRRVATGELKQHLIDEIKKQNKPYGIMIKKMIGGETETGSRDFQVFKGKPLYLYKVYPDGREELVRGVEFVGTPIAMINKVILAGDDDTAFNAFCGAESGFIPVSTIAPSALLSEVELQAAHGPRLRRPILPPPVVQN